MIIGIDASRAGTKQKTGTEYYSYEIIKSLLEIDKTNHYILYSKNRLEGELANLPKNAVNKILKFPRLWSQIRLSSEMIKNPPDVLFVSAHTIPIRHPKNTVVTIHDVGFRQFPDLYTPLERYYHNFSMKFSVRYAKKIIAISNATKRDLIKIYNADESKMTVIYHGYDKNKYFVEKNFDEQKYKDQLKYAPYLFFIGRLEAKKNIVNLVKAYAMLRKEPKNHHKLVLAGRPGYRYEDIKTQIDNLPENIRTDVIELGYVPDEDAAKYLRGADILVFPSKFEGFGMPLVEAMASGVPVVASNTTSIPEVVEDAGILCNPDKPFDFAAACSKIINSKLARDNLVAKGLKRAKDFSWTDAAKKTLKVIESAYSSTKEPPIF